jgi:acetyl-CoA carboxylase biotin carboxyl carrier protein
MMVFKKNHGSPGPAPEDQLRLIRMLADILDETGLTEIELEQDGTRVRVARKMNVKTAPSALPIPAGPELTSEPAPAVSAAKASTLDPATHAGVVKSPMVGTVYRSPSPGASAFIEVGAEVKQGQTLLIIEAMKTMNQIPAPRAGKVVQILVENGQPVEYGEPLAIIE